MKKNATKLKDESNGEAGKKSQVLPSAKSVKAPEEIDKGVLEVVAKLSSETFSSDEEAISAVINEIGSHYKNQSEEFQVFMSEIIESDPALRADIISGLKIKK